MNPNLTMIDELDEKIADALREKLGDAAPNDKLLLECARAARDAAFEVLRDPWPEVVDAGYDAASERIGGDVIGTISIQSVIGTGVMRAMLSSIRSPARPRS